MPIKLSRKMRNYQGMAEVSMKAGRIEDGFKYIEKAAECASKHDKLPEKVYSKCILYSCHPYDRKWEAKPCIELKKEFCTRI